MLNKRKLAEVKRLVKADYGKPALALRQTSYSNDAGLKPKSFRRACKQMKLKHYKCKKRPRGTNGEVDKAARLEFCDFIMRQPEEFFTKYICTDETTFR